MKPKPILLVSIVFACHSLLAGCQEVETKESSVPVSAAEAKRTLQGTMPIPDSASHVRYYLSGSTQDWDLFISYRAPYGDVEQIINQELKRLADTERLISGVSLTFNKQAMSKATLPSSISVRAPKWWNPLTITNGYFIGSSNPDSGARFWVDRNEEKVYFFDHF